MLSEKYKKASFCILILMVVYSCIWLFLYYLPYLLDVIKFYNSDDIKYGIASGYISNSFIQREILYHLMYGVLGIIHLICLLTILIISLFKNYMSRKIGIIIISQNITSLSFQMWINFFINRKEDIVFIDIKLWFTIVLIIAGISIWLSTKQKIFQPLLYIITILQIINTITLTAEYIASIYIPQVAFHCFNGIVIPILYLVFLVLSHKKSSSE